MLVERGFQVRHRHDVGQVPLVVLDDVRHPTQALALRIQILFEILQAFQIGIHPLELGVRHEDDAVRPFQNQLTACP